MAFLTQIYSPTWLLPPVLSDIEAEQIKKERQRKKPDGEKSSLTVSFSVLLRAVNMLPSQLY